MWALLVLLPVISLCVLSIASGNNCFAAQPVWSDELDYWREVYSFSSLHSLSFGLNGFLGYPAKIGTLGCHGLAPFIIYGLPALIFGWATNSIVIWNMMICMLAFVIFIALIRPSKMQCLVIAVIWLLYAPILVYAPTSMVELPHYALIVILIAAVLRLWKQPASKTWLIIGFAICTLMAFLRLHNIVFFIPLVFIASEFHFDRRFILFACLALLLSILAWYTSGLFSSGYPESFMYHLSQTPSITGKLSMLFSHTLDNTKRLLAFKEGAAQVTQRYLYLTVMFACLIRSIHLRHSHVQDHNAPDIIAERRWCLLGFLILFIALGFILCAYDVFDWRDYRSLAPVLWGVILLVIMTCSRHMQAMAIAGVIVVFVLSISTLSSSSASESTRFQTTTDSSEQAVSQIIPLSDEATDKTLLVSATAPLSQNEIYQIDPSIGFVGDAFSDISFARESNIAYVLTKKPADEMTGYEAIGEMNCGMLYRRTSQ